MELIISFAADIIKQYGYIGIFILTASEQFIFPVPADIFVVLGTSLGLVFSKVMVIILIASALGSVIGYYLGRFLGHPVMLWLFGQKRLDRVEQFIKKYGVWGIIVAGLSPFPFKIVTWTAGIFEMPLHKFILGVILGRWPRYLLTAFAGTLFIKTKFYASVQMSAILLGALQGFTEFLPISSSGHLILLEQFVKLPQTLTPASLEVFDIMLHGGSLLAILVFFWKDWWQVLREIWGWFRTRSFDRETLAFKLMIGTIPSIILGLFFSDLITGPLRHRYSVAIFFIVTSLYFLFVEWKRKNNTIENVTAKKSVLIGFAQALALIPGLSRSGLTIATGMLTGLKRDIAAKFSFMLGAVAIFAANIYALLSVSGDAQLPDMQFTLIGVITSFVMSLIAITWLLKFLRKHTLRPFAFYLILTGVLVLSFM